jgi:DNA-binding HxlR family transcriptional regulator
MLVIKKDRRPDEVRFHRGDLFVPKCPSRQVLEHVTSRWGVLVLILLRDATQRFSELRRAAAGVSEKMLAQTLRDLERDGFVRREAFAEVPPRVEYALTPMGREVAAHVEALAEWIEVNTPRIWKAQVEAEGGQGALESRETRRAPKISRRSVPASR